MASAGDDRQIILWQVATGKQRLMLPRHSDAIYSLAFSPDGSRWPPWASGTRSACSTCNDGRETSELVGPGDDLRCVVFSPDGKQLAVAGRNGQIRVWSMPAGTMQLEIAAGHGRLRTLAYLPDGEKLVSAGDGRIDLAVGHARRARKSASSVAPRARCCRWPSAAMT